MTVDEMIRDDVAKHIAAALVTVDGAKSEKGRRMIVLLAFEVAEAFMAERKNRGITPDPDYSKDPT